MTTTYSTETLTDILGAEFWAAAFPTAQAATEHACRRMDEGRMAVTYTDADGNHVAAWGVAA